MPPHANKIIPKAADGTRTHDLVLTKDALYQLSYSSTLGAFNHKRAKGIEPSPPAWKAGALPLSYARIPKTFTSLYFFN